MNNRIHQTARTLHTPCWRRNSICALLLITMLALSACSSSGGQSSSSSSKSSPGAPSEAPGQTPNAKITPEYQAASIVLSWSPPATRQDGSELPYSAVAGYEITLASVVNGQPRMLRQVSLPGPQTTTFDFGELDPADYEIVVFTFDTGNSLSEPSAPVTIHPSDFPPKL